MIDTDFFMKKWYCTKITNSDDEYLSKYGYETGHPAYEVIYFNSKKNVLYGMNSILHEVLPRESIHDTLNMVLNADYADFDSAFIHAPRPFRPMLLDWYALKELFNNDQEQREAILSVRSDIENGFTNFDENYIDFLTDTATNEAKDIQELLAKVGDKDTLTIYRGETKQSTPYKQALSWTLDKEKARFFATRFDSDEPTIYKAKVKTVNVIAYDNDREEEEVLVHSDSLERIEITN